MPPWLPAVLFGLVTLLLFRAFVFSDRMLYGGDTLSLGYMAREFYADAVRQGTFPLWSPVILGGMPFVAALFSGDALYPTSLLLFVVEPYRALGWKLVIHVFLAGLFMFGWARVLGRSRAAALLAGLAYALAPFLVTLVHPGHDGKLFVTALTPLLFWAMEWTFVRRGLLPYVAVALVVTLVTLTTHFQLAYFLFGAAGVYYLFRCVQLARGGRGHGEEGARARGRSRVAVGRFGLFLVASVLGAAAAGVQLLPAFDYVMESSRRTATTTRATPEANRIYASSWSMHPEEVVAYVVPEFAGNDAGLALGARTSSGWIGGTYWGRNPTRDNSQYAGLVVLLLAVAAFFGGARKGVRRFLAGLGIVAVLYALGEHTPVWGLFYALVPGVDLFRAPDSVSYLLGFGLVTLSAFGVDRVLAAAREEEGEGGEALLRALWIATAVLGVGLLLAASGVLFSFWTSVVYSDIGPRSLQKLDLAEPFIVRGFFYANLLAAATAATVWAGRRGALKPFGVVAVLGLLVLVDGFRVSAPFIQTLDFRTYAAADPVTEEVVRRQASELPFRVVDFDFQFGSQSVQMARFGVEEANGHHPNDLARYRELIGMQGSSDPTTLFTIVPGPPARIQAAPHVLSILNVRYVAVPGEIQGASALAQRQLGGRVVESLYRTEDLTGAADLPRARLVADAVVVPEDEAVATILDPSFDPVSTAVLEEAPPLELAGGPVQGGVEWVERGLNRQTLRVRTDRNALLVIADNWFPAWQATVDGEPEPVLRAYHTLRAVPVGPGEHTVELRYASTLLRAGLGVSLATLVLLGVVGTTSWLRGRRGKRRTEG